MLKGENITTETEAAKRAERLGVAFTEGRIAGGLLLPAGLNPYFADPDLRAEWERGRLSATAARLERHVNAARRVA